MESGASKPEKDEIAKGITGKERHVDAVDSVDGRTMLHSAVLGGDVEAVRFLVENGAGNVRDRDGKVPLWYALQHRDADVRGRLEAELGAHAAQILVEVEDAVQVYLTHGVATTTRTPTRTPGVAVDRSSGYATTAPLTDPHMDMAKDTNTSTGDRHLGEDDLDGDTGALWHTDGRKVEWLRKTEDDNKNNKNSNGGEDLLCWLRGLPKVDPPLGYTDEHVRHMEAGFRVVCKRLLEDMRGRREAARTRGGHVEVEDWMADAGVGVGETAAAEQVGALQEVMGHTVAFFEDYLAQYVEGHVGDDTRVDESETRPLMEEVRRWLRVRGGGGGDLRQLEIT